MSRTIPEQSKAKLRDAELAEAEQQLQQAREQLETVQAEISRSRQLLDAISTGSPETGRDGAGAQFDGVIAPFPAGNRRRDGLRH